MNAMTRRNWLRTAGRATVFGGLGVLAVLLGRRAESPARRRETPCSGGGRCGACPALAGCGLPRGLSARVALKREGEPDHE